MVCMSVCVPFIQCHFLSLLATVEKDNMTGGQKCSLVRSAHNKHCDGVFYFTGVVQQQAGKVEEASRS